MSSNESEALSWILQLSTSFLAYLILYWKRKSGRLVMCPEVLHVPLPLWVERIKA